MKIEEARSRAADALQQQGSASLAALIRIGIMDDHPTVRKILAGGVVSPPEDVDHSEPEQPLPSVVEMGTVDNLAAVSDQSTSSDPLDGDTRLQ